ncbi:MAG TPA: hypothetical protein VK774_00050 [Solirubrobacteraceae bacterium]|nr:hypothetical protein [Solirubrobacteraceae bacterium]
MYDAVARSSIEKQSSSFLAPCRPGGVAAGRTLDGTSMLETVLQYGTGKADPDDGS